MSTVGEERTLAYTVMHFTVALGVAVFSGGLAFWIAGAIFSYAMRGPEAIEGSTDGVVASLVFSVVLVGLFGGIPAIVIGAVMHAFRAHSLAAFIAAGIAAAIVAPVLVMLFTPIGMDGWSMLVIAIPAGAAAAVAAWYYLKRYTALLT